MRDAKDVDQKELQEAIGAINGAKVLPSKIEIKGETVEDMMKNLVSAVESLEEAEANKLPEKVINMYNGLIEDEVEEVAEEESVEEEVVEEEVVEEVVEEEEVAEEEVVEQKKEQKVTKPVVAKAPTKAEAKSKEKGEAKIGVIGSILGIIKKKGPISKDDILKELVKSFPDREEKSMKNTLQVQIGGKKRPLRMEKEKELTFVISDEGKYSVK